MSFDPRLRLPLHDPRLIHERRCRTCGCTDQKACEGGCSWVEEDLCSQCAGLGDEEL